MTNWERYCDWLKQRDIDGVLMPDDRGLFHKGDLVCVLPFLRVYWRGKSGDDRPPWRTGEWHLLDGKEYQWTRLLRADQALDWMEEFYSAEEDLAGFKIAVTLAMKTWLVPVAPPLTERPHILARRLEAVRVSLRKREDSHGKEEYLAWTREPDRFPDGMRRAIAGLDPVHTPENGRAGLTRYLAEGWEIDDIGVLRPADISTPWGPSTSIIPYRLSDAPRRLMLGASLQARAMPLVESDRPVMPPELGDHWCPPGRNLRAVFSTFQGWTHEEAVVVSRSAVEKLKTDLTFPKRVLVPAVAYYKLEVQARGEKVQRGQPLVRGFVDLYALGLRRHEADVLGAEDGWLEIAMPDAQSPVDGELIEDVGIRTLRTPKWRASVAFKIRGIVPLGVGDKLATRHGIKGVVSQICEDKDMPDHPEGKAEIVLSPVGVVRRRAMGQFREAAVNGTTTALPHNGIIFVMRQPQDALPRCRVRGAGQGDVRGQRYGEMEFWALMAHGARSVARELLSLERSTLSLLNAGVHGSWRNWPWMAAEGTLCPSGDHRVVATQALERYLSLLGTKIESGVLETARDATGTIHVDFDPAQVHIVSSTRQSELHELRANLENSRWFLDKGGAVALDLSLNPVRLALGGHGRKNDQRRIEVIFKKIPVLPPWLRPPADGRWHPLTKQCWKLLVAAAWSAWGRQTMGSLQSAAESYLRIAFDEKLGAGGFLRRNVLGRRLTRSARAVIVPDPALRIDQISVPRFVFDEIFMGLPEENRHLVLVNRNPTLHRRGLLALRPVVDESNRPVFGMPLGILKVMGADFDGDQASIVALETKAAYEEAVQLLPGSQEMRTDPFRENRPAFPLLRELSAVDKEWDVACSTDLSQEEWCVRHHRLLQQLLADTGDGWAAAEAGLPEHKAFWKGLAEAEWLDLAQQEMEKVYSVRQKGQQGGILRRELYRRRFETAQAFKDAVAVTQAVTERLTQEALSVKSQQRRPERSTFDPRAFFTNPASMKSSLTALDDQTLGPLDPEAVCARLGPAAAPTGLLAWMARPTLKTLVDVLVDRTLNEPPLCYQTDPRIAWFLA